MKKCPSCRGTGKKPYRGYRRAVCPTCKGSGEVADNEPAKGTTKDD